MDTTRSPLNAARVRESLTIIQEHLFNANLQLNELQLYVESDRENEIRDYRIAVQAQADEIAQLHKLIATLQMEKATLQSNQSNGDLVSPHFFGKENIKEEYLFRCDLCNCLFSSKFSYDRHKRHVHERQYKFPCKNCSAGFETTARLAAHLQRVHGVCS